MGKRVHDPREDRRAVMIRMSKSLHQLLTQLADDNERSINQEIVFRLRRALEPSDIGAKRATG
jgi:hypothetical protein